MPVDALIAAAKHLRDRLKPMTFAPPVAHVYNPLEYAWDPYERFLRRYAQGHKRVIMLGMNPGPFGMMQTGVPFGEVAAVRDWMGIDGRVAQPADQHPKRAIAGFGCTRSEVSGRRLWGWAAERFGSADAFFNEFFVLNYCPLVFLEASGRNRTPDQLPARELKPLYDACDEHLKAAIGALKPQWAIGIGGFAEKRLKHVLQGHGNINVGTVLHPSPASPAANRGWAPLADAQLCALGILQSPP